MGEIFAPYKWEALFARWPDILAAFGTTVGISAGALVLALALGFVFSMLSVSRFKPLRAVARLYVEVVQNVPLLLQVFVLYAVFPLLGLSLASFWIGVLAIGVYHGAYMSEVVRSGIGSIHRGQFEAAKSQGFTYLQTMMLVILPQAMRIILPPLAVQAANLVKNTSVLALIAGGELMYFSNSFAGDTSYYGPAYVAAAVLYFAICFPLSRAAVYLEHRMRSRRHVVTGDATEVLEADGADVTPGTHDLTGRAAAAALAGGVTTMMEGTTSLVPPVSDKGRYLTYAELYGVDRGAWPDPAPRQLSAPPQAPQGPREALCLAGSAASGRWRASRERRPEMSDIMALLTWTNLRFLLEGLGLTLVISALSIACSVALGAVISIMRGSRLRALRGISIAYVELFKNTPLLLWIMFTFFVAQLPPLPAAVVAFTLFTAASVAEIVRGGLASVPAGQYEAARSQGFSAPQMYVLIILPQALRNMVPALLSQFVTTIKDTSYLWGAMALQELMGRGMILMNSFNSTVQIFATFGLLALIYFAVCFTLSQFVRAYQKRLKGAR